jgi:hypothetical protein
MSGISTSAIVPTVTAVSGLMSARLGQGHLTTNMSAKDAGYWQNVMTSGRDQDAEMWGRIGALPLPIGQPMPLRTTGEPRKGTTMADNLNLTSKKLARIRAQMYPGEKQSKAKFARRLGISWRTYYRFETEERDVPKPIARLVEAIWYLDKFRQQYGVPKLWTKEWEKLLKDKD